MSSDIFSVRRLRRLREREAGLSALGQNSQKTGNTRYEGTIYKASIGGWIILHLPLVCWCGLDSSGSGIKLVAEYFWKCNELSGFVREILADSKQKHIPIEPFIMIRLFLTAGHNTKIHFSKRCWNYFPINIQSICGTHQPWYKVVIRMLLVRMSLWLNFVAHLQNC